MVAAILRARGPALATEGNFNNEIGVPLTLLKLRTEHHAAVVELGMSAPGELQRITAIARPDAAVLTLIAAEHLEFLKDLDGVAEAEGELYRGLLPGLRRRRQRGRRALRGAGGAGGERREEDLLW